MKKMTFFALFYRSDYKMLPMQLTVPYRVAKGKESLSAARVRFPNVASCREFTEIIDLQT